MLKNKNVVITGARRGIGRKTVEVCAKLGANIWACARAKDEAFMQDMRKIAEENNVEIWPVFFDLSKEDEIKAAVVEIRKKGVSIDALINVAGIVAESTNFQMTTIDKMKQVMDINFFANTIITQYISRLMVRQNSGSIVNVASIAGIDGEPAQYEYAASKAALIGGTRNLARELSKYNIRVNAVAPGMVKTDMGAQIDEDLKQAILNKVIMKRMGEVEEIANVIAFLASDMSSYITGQVIRVDGGM